MLKERQHFNSFKAMSNSLYTLNFTLISIKSAVVELVRRLVVHKARVGNWMGDRSCIASVIKFPLTME